MGRFETRDGGATVSCFSTSTGYSCGFTPHARWWSWRIFGRIGGEGTRGEEQSGQLEDVMDERKVQEVVAATMWVERTLEARESEREGDN